MAITVSACRAHLFKWCGQDGTPHKQVKLLPRARCHRKLTIVLSCDYDCSSQIFSNGTSLGRRMLLLTACLPVMTLENDVNLFRSNNRSNLLAVEVEEVEIQAIKSEIRKVLSKAKAAGLLRLVFHDAGTFDMAKNTGGMNGSIIYELNRPENTGLERSVKVLQKVKAVLDLAMQVSWADLIALAGAEAVALCGGPDIPVRLGRQDKESPDPEGELPVESLNAAGLIECFQKKGFSTQDLVALSGAHTLGNKGFGKPTSFDNSYFHTLLEKPWLKATCFYR
ncbi:putative L-ascorbate peroxidase 6 isoform X2 [Cryptomeria japonica]|uniref:putative L-ascorbate peroxidase 6 isoform X2 n=1 Tax=Cryptomeria japonica TaxID=3369 RepID=UPI0027DA43F0|nr:putative L-ascorbate peroxidase 6 isoform X2 [Cryptomeria japonica]